MTRKTTLTMASVIALALAAGAVQAQDAAPAPGPAGPMAHFSKLDTDNDGKITRAEFDAPRLERIKAMDPDADGVITLEEMKKQAVDAAVKRAEAMAERKFKALDLDGDGKVSAAEALVAKPQGRGKGPRGDIFSMLDADKDGVLTTEELDKAHKAHHPRPPMGPGKRGPHGDDHGPRGPEHGPKGPHGAPPAGHAPVEPPKN